MLYRIQSSQVTVVLLMFSSLVFIAATISTAFFIVADQPTVRVIGIASVDTLLGEVDGDDEAVSRSYLQVAQNNEASEDQRKQAVLRLTDIRGSDAADGLRVFRQHCIACHKVGDEGADLAPELTDVGKRLRRDEIVESIVHPSAVVEDKYKTTMVLTLDGEVITGLKVEETDDFVKIFDSKDYHEILLDDVDEMATKDSSSMPEKLADAMSPTEFFNLVEFLCDLKPD